MCYYELFVVLSLVFRRKVSVVCGTLDIVKFICPLTIPEKTVSILLSNGIKLFSQFIA